MKKKFFSILLLFVILIGLSACGKKSKVEEVIEKFNNCKTVKSYKDYGYEMNASFKNDVLTITTDIDGSKSVVDFKVDGNILSNESVSSDHIMTILVLIDSVGQTYGYKDGELAQNLNAFPKDIEKYTLDKEGLELVIKDDSISLKMDLSKKVPLIDMKNYHLSEDDLDILKQIIEDGESGNQTGKSGNIAYDIFVDKEQSYIKIGQDNELSDSAYKSILSALKVMYGEETAKHFEEIYPKLLDKTTTVEAFNIEIHNEVVKDDSMFDGTKVVIVNINNKDLK